MVVRWGTPGARAHLRDGGGDAHRPEFGSDVPPRSSEPQREDAVRRVGAHVPEQGRGLPRAWLGDTLVRSIDVDRIRKMKAKLDRIPAEVNRKGRTTASRGRCWSS